MEKKIELELSQRAERTVGVWIDTKGGVKLEQANGDRSISVIRLNKSSAIELAKNILDAYDRKL